MGLPYGSIARKTVPRDEQETAMDFSVLFEFGVRNNTWSLLSVLEKKEKEYCLHNSILFILVFSSGLLQVLRSLLWFL